MADNKFEKKAADALDHIDKVYDDQVKNLDHVAKFDEWKDKETVKHVKDEIEYDGILAAGHLVHIEHVIAHQVDRVEDALDRLERRVADEASESSVARAEKHVESVTESAVRHVEATLEHEGKHLERDFKAAVRHVKNGAEKVGKRDDALEKDLDDSVQRVADAIDHALEVLTKD